MEINGKVVEIEKHIIIDGNNGSYRGSKIIYKDGEGKVKEKAFHENTFKYNKAFEKELHALAAGDSFVATLEKKGEYWNWLAIKKSTGETKSMPTKPAAASTGGNWETAEERKNKQVYIIRQSSITAALKMLELNGNKKITVNDVTLLADELTNWVLGLSQQEADETMADLENDIPY